MLVGVDTQFTIQVQPKAHIQITLPHLHSKDTSISFALTVVSVVSDHQLVVKEHLPNMLRDKVMEADIPLYSAGPYSYKITPFVDQAEMFAKVTERLVQGGCVGIFPEGGSHDRPELLPLKAGVTIMALR
jgi:glycerol-3-phosphate O-acyltransferase/dihydroxyacetone phosphate acyltransferase